jgi:hypothetical protein
MSRSGYSEDLDNWAIIKWRGQVASAIRGKRGQAFFRELVAALDAMPVKELISDDLVSEDGSAVCALGALGKAKGIDLTGIDPYDHETLSATFNIAHQLACEVMYENDEYWQDDPAGRWQRMRRWAESHLVGR